VGNEFSSLPVLSMAWVQFPPWQSISWDCPLAGQTLPTGPEPVWQNICSSPLN